MKTAISLPDELFRQAETAARDLRVSRSHLYTEALREFLNRRQTLNVTEQLNKIYSDQRATLDGSLHHAQLSSLEKDPW